MKENTFHIHEQARDPEPDLSEKKELQPDRMRQAIEVLAGCYSFESALEALDKAGVLKNQLERVRGICAEKPYLADFLEKHEEYLLPLTMMELYDTRTFEHCVESFRIARDKLHKILEYGIVLEDKIRQEQAVSVDEFLGGSLLHDVGKIEISHFIINSCITNEQWIELFLDDYARTADQMSLHRIAEAENIHIPDTLFIAHTEEPDIADTKKAELGRLLRNNHVRMIKYAPISLGTDESLGKSAFTIENMIQLDRLGIPRNTPLHKIIEGHEKSSREILAGLGLEKESILAGIHHDYEGARSDSSRKTPFTVSSFRISNILSEFIKLADIQDAMTRKRSYHDSNSRAAALNEIIENVREKKIHFFVAYLWISDEMNGMETQVTERSFLKDEKADKEYAQHLRRIRSFLEKIKNLIDKHLDNPMKKAA